jgi:hypothetical protein
VRLLDDKTPLDDEQTRPNYYGGPDNPYEPVKVIDRLGLGAGFYFGSALKYLFRAGKKSDEELSDLKKALWFLSNGAELDYCLPTQIDDRRDPEWIDNVVEAWKLPEGLDYVVHCILHGLFHDAIITLDGYVKGRQKELGQG